MDALAKQLQSPEPCVDAENGSVTVNDLDPIQKVNRELEQQLGDKNRVSSLHPRARGMGSFMQTNSTFITNVFFQTIRQLQQRLAELKRTLQKELVSLHTSCALLLGLAR